jgi:type IV secretory pathway VirB10-like protein
MIPRALEYFSSAWLMVGVCAAGGGLAAAQQQPAAAAVEEFGTAQPAPEPPQSIPLTVQAGVPLHVALVKAVPIKLTGIPVQGRLVQPVYVFDKLVIPAGTTVLGTVSQVVPISHKRRALDIANGDFTPHRTAQLSFDTLVLKDGTKLPISTAVSKGVPDVIHLSAGRKGKKKGRVTQAVAEARQEAKAREQQAIAEVKAPGKMKRIEAALAAELPYHRQSFAAGTQFTAELKSPLELGHETRTLKDLADVGGEIPPGSIVHVRLLTALSSATDHAGKPVQAEVSEPVFSKDRHLILPEGAKLNGTVNEAVPARRLGRNGQLRFTFHQIEVRKLAPRRVEASLQGVDAASGAHLKLDEEGGAHAVSPKTRFVAPAIDVLLATSSLDGLDPHHHEHPGLHQGPDVAGGGIRGAAGFGLLGSIVGIAAHWRPVSAIFAFYGAGWSVYSHVMARGNNVAFARNTPMEIRFGTHQGPPEPAAHAAPSRHATARPGTT